ncbi:MAG: potassium-transporting ATPase subunit KdpC, partial [Methanomicrobiales archaeon]|nr:potassium-transporting ATPase subunit KdpC [Methanomicrobiales archaeon]
MHSISTAVKLFGILFILTGIIYPIIIMLVATTAFPYQAHGSLITSNDGTIIGSELIGQNFSLPRYFQSRPSATLGSAYNAASSGGSNLGPTNPVLLEQVAVRIRLLQDRGIRDPIPSDLVTASASGLDPHISLEAALIQVPVVARERVLREDVVMELVLSEVEWNSFPFTQPYVNVLSLNRALDGISNGA